MVEISNAQHASLVRLLAYFATVPADSVRGREARRQSSLLAKALRKKSPARNNTNTELTKPSILNTIPVMPTENLPGS